MAEAGAAGGMCILSEGLRGGLSWVLVLGDKGAELGCDRARLLGVSSACDPDSGDTSGEGGLHAESDGADTVIRGDNGTDGAERRGWWWRM